MEDQSMSMAQGLEDQAAGHLRFIKASEAEQPKTRLESQKSTEEIQMAPIFTHAAHATIQANPSEQPAVFPQYGLIGSEVTETTKADHTDTLIYTNTTAPWAAMICGSQGSGKSHTLSCILENCLIKSLPVGNLTSPLAGLVFHYDKFTGFTSTQLCEAAYLCSAKIPVRILVSPTNFVTMKDLYSQAEGLSPKHHPITVKPMFIPPESLTTAMMKTLMGVDNKSDCPLYMEMVLQILREMATADQGRQGFNYTLFRQRIDAAPFKDGQLAPLKIRLSILESFLSPATSTGGFSDQPPANFDAWKAQVKDLWRFDKGTLTIVDLSCPFVGPDDACALFNICISLFMKSRQKIGRILVLDEAHKYLVGKYPEAHALTDTLLSLIRQQRHLGTRVVVATQEPTIASDLLDLCNVTIVHRFSSPAWFAAIERHIAGAALKKQPNTSSKLFEKIVSLPTGEALVFCPSAVIIMKKKKHDFEEGYKTEKYTEDSRDLDVWFYTPTPERKEENERKGEKCLSRMGAEHIHLRVRDRLTLDGGRSMLAM